MSEKAKFPSHENLEPVNINQRQPTRGLIYAVARLVGLSMPLFSPSRILRSASHSAQSLRPSWSATLNLPKSRFPARANTEAIERYRRSCADDLYNWQRASRPANVRGEGGQNVDNEFVLHDGPPFANGDVHLGHALNKILKDVHLRYQLQHGKRVHFRPGWDCHGLPIELKALQEHAIRSKADGSADSRSISAPDVRSLCRQLANDTVALQKASFRQWGVMGDWDAPYLTMSAEFEIQQLEVFREMVERGLISRSLRPVHWSPSSRTALAESELEYVDGHVSTAAFVQMPMTQLPDFLAQNVDISATSVSALIWTTTPWTLPANQAIAVNTETQYVLVALKNPDGTEWKQDCFLIIAEECLNHVKSFLPDETTVEIVHGPFPGSSLIQGKSSCYNCFTGERSPFLGASWVTTTSGTGLVHCAPGHGMEDYLLCRENGIMTVRAPVNDEGKFTDDVFARDVELVQPIKDSMVGLDAQTDGVHAVLQFLSDGGSLPQEMTKNSVDLVLATHNFKHRHPIDWRTKEPVLIRATAQWFADVSAVKEKVHQALDSVSFFPAKGMEDLKSYIDGRNQWCISRQRVWGVPIPAVYHVESGEACITVESIDHIINVIRKRGTDAWFEDDANSTEWIHPSMNPEDWQRGRDTMDVWFDSGSTWTTLPRGKADLYLEGRDQHRGWFQSSLLTKISTHKQGTDLEAPFATLIHHGFILDEKGYKMSKSRGNVISPKQILDGDVSVLENGGLARKGEMGPDALRLLMTSTDAVKDVRVSAQALHGVHQTLRKYRVTLRFLLGVLVDFDLSTSRDLARHRGELSFADRAILHRLWVASSKHRSAFAQNRIYKGIIRRMNRFVATDLSAFYIEAAKDAMYAGPSLARQRVQNVLYVVLNEMMMMLAPVCPFLVEEAWEFHPDQLKTGAGIQHPLRRTFTNAMESFRDEEVQDALENLQILNTAVKGALEQARNASHMTSGLACRVHIRLDRAGDLKYNERVLSWQSSGELSDLLGVSETSVSMDGGSQRHEYWTYSRNVGERSEYGQIEVFSPRKSKCVRCWKYTADDTRTPCGRCRDVLAEKNISLEAMLEATGLGRENEAA